MRRILREKKNGFTLVELVVFVAIFATTAVFLVGILNTVTRTQLRQTSVNEVTDEVTFVAGTIQRLVQGSSLIANDPPGVASTTLILRRASSTVDTTKIFVDPGMTAIYLQEINQDGVTSTTVPLTSSKVKVSNFLVTKYQTPGGPAVVQVDLTLDYNTTNPGGKISKSWRGAIARVSAATFDSTLVPTADGTLNLGSAGAKWNSGYFANDVSVVNGRLILGTYTTIPSGMRIFSAGDIGFPSSAYGVVLKTPDGTKCFRVGVSNTGGLTTTTVAVCPQ